MSGAALEGLADLLGLCFGEVMSSYCPDADVRQLLAVCLLDVLCDRGLLYVCDLELLYVCDALDLLLALLYVLFVSYEATCAPYRLLALLAI